MNEFVSVYQEETDIIPSNIFKSVVKIFVIDCEPFYYQPWDVNPSSQTSSSGFIISATNREILCNAHSVSNAISIRIRKYGESKKYHASIKYIGHEWDLAILTVKDNKFWNDNQLKSIQLDNIIPSLQETITVLGYPTGGDDLSVTKGVISRIEYTIYEHGLQLLFSIQIDAAINPGNSGGPCLNKKGEVIGVAFQTDITADNVGYCIPIRVIKHFMKSKKTNINYKIPELGCECTHIENYSLKQYLKMIINDDEELEGIMVTDIEPFTDAYNKLKKHDVILEIDGISVGDDGTIPFRFNSRIHCYHLITNKLDGDSVNLKILRNGKLFNIDLIITSPLPLCPVTLYDQDIDYFIFGGLVFLPLSRPYLQCKYGSDTWRALCPSILKYIYFNQKRESINQEIILLSQVLPSDINFGYHDLSNLILKSINNKKINNLKDLANIIDDIVYNNNSNNQDNNFIKFEFISNDIIILNLNEAIYSINNILKTHKIEYDRSTNLRNIRRINQNIIKKYIDDDDCRVSNDE